MNERLGLAVAAVFAAHAPGNRIRFFDGSENDPIVTDVPKRPTPKDVPDDRPAPPLWWRKRLLKRKKHDRR